MYQSKRILKDKGLIIMSVISLLAVIALVAGIMFFDNRNSGNNDDVVGLAENTTTSSTQKVDSNVTKETTTEQQSTEPQTTADDNNDTVLENADARNTDSDNTDTRESSEDTTEASTETDADTSVNAPASQLSFTNESILLWPVETNDIIIDFSMDTTTYFATLDMYKTSDAVCIRSDLGSPVYASADGVVLNNSYNEEIGHFIEMDLGNGYQITYGQLKDLQVDEGDTLCKEDLIGYISEPTKYYTVEGANLYLKLTADGIPTDPLDYLDFE